MRYTHKGAYLAEPERNAMSEARGISFHDAAPRPQHGIDVAIAQAALARLKGSLAASAVAGGDTRVWAVRYRMARAICRDLARSPWSTMTAGQRRVLSYWAGDEAVARAERANTSDVPEVLRVLPKRPPTRKVE